MIVRAAAAAAWMGAYLQPRSVGGGGGCGAGGRMFGVEKSRLELVCGEITAHYLS